MRKLTRGQKGQSPGILRLLLTGALLLTCIFLSACEVELYSDITEHEANEMMTALLAADIRSSKVAGAKNTWTVKVDEEQLPAAMSILEKEGLPRPKYDNIAEIFKKQGMISSPLVERAKYIYAVSQEVAQTLSELDGVLVARVHLVLSEVDEMTEKIQPASASVFIKYLPNTGIPSRVRDIKKFVQYSIPELGYDKISVFLFPTIVNDVDDVAGGAVYTTVLGIKVQPRGASLVWLLISTTAFFSLLCGCQALYILRKKCGRPQRRLRMRRRVHDRYPLQRTGKTAARTDRNAAGAGRRVQPRPDPA